MSPRRFRVGRVNGIQWRARRLDGWGMYKAAEPFAADVDAESRRVVGREVLVNEEVSVLWRTLPSGKMRPTSFVWRDRSRYVSDVGRAWEERIGGQSVRCFLLQGVDGSSYELRWEPANDVWRLQRAWLRDSVV